MRSYLAHSDGSPSATVVLDAGALPAEPELSHRLALIHTRLHARPSAPLISKYALIQPSRHPMYDLDYRFAQMIPGVAPSFDFQGSCGHSLLAAITVASRWGWLPTLAPGRRVRVRVLNNNDSLVCEIEQAARGELRCTAHFIQPPATRLGALLLDGSPITALTTACGLAQVSLVSTGNPYVFVDAASLGIGSARELFDAGETLFARLQAIRAAAIAHLGWEPRSVFPKIAAVGAFERGRLAVRAISVPSWHPTLALTGAACLAAAATIGGTLVARLALQSGCDPAALRIETPGGFTTAGCAASGSQPEDLLHYISVADKRARLIGPLPRVAPRRPLTTSVSG